MEYNKKSEVELEVVSTPVVVPEVMTYDVDTLKFNELHILKEINTFVKIKTKELEDIRTLIAKCEELSIRSKVEVAKEIQADTVKLEEEKLNSQTISE